MRSPSAAAIRHDLVLVGGGHAHIQVLERWAMAPVPGARLTLVVDRPVAVYSGMVPGFVAGQYPREALEIDVRPLALRAGARCIVTPATGLDTGARRLVLQGRPPIAYDTVSFDVGSTVAGLGSPGVREHAIPRAPSESSCAGWRRCWPPRGIAMPRESSWSARARAASR
jgi:selenide,water dikinase